MINAKFSNNTNHLAHLTIGTSSEMLDPGASVIKNDLPTTKTQKPDQQPNISLATQTAAGPAGPGPLTGTLDAEVTNTGLAAVTLDMYHQPDVTIGAGQTIPLTGVVGPPPGNTYGIGFRIPG